MTARPVSYDFAAFRLDAAEKVLFHEGRPVSLTPKATETLLALVERHGRLVTKEELFHIVWPDAFVEENNLAQNISMLRRALGESAGGEHFIETVPKRGYRFVGDVAERFQTENDSADERPDRPLVAPTPTGARPPVVSGADRTIRSATMWGLIAVALVAVALVAVSRERQRDDSRAPVNTADAERSDHKDVTRIAVLPFLNVGSPADEHFVTGMTEEITSRLAGLNRLAVPSSTTIAGYDRRGKSLQAIGADLGVAYVVEGSVRWAQASDAMRVRITPKLIRVADDTTVWTQRYETSISDLFKVQADIAYQVTGALQVALDARERRSVEARPTADTEAYLAFLRGIAAHRQGASDTASQAHARTELEQAVERDPRFAIAWSWLARVYASQYRTGAHRTPEIRQAAFRAAQTAIDLNTGLPDGHLALALVLFTDRQYESARRELDIAKIGLPNSAELWQLLGLIAQREGHWAESLDAFKRAFDLEPGSSAEWITIHYLHLRQYSEARRFIGIARAANLTGAVVPDAWLRFSESGDVGAARPVLEAALASRWPADDRVRGLLARLEWFDGRYQRALDLIEAMSPPGAWLPTNFRFPASLAAAQVYESMGRREGAVKNYAAAIADLRRKLASSPDDYQVEAAMAMATVGLGQAAQAIRHAERAVELLPASKDAAEAPFYLYLLAQIHARLGDYPAAFATLDKMFSGPGFYNENWVQRDPGFAALRAHPSFRSYVDRWSLQRGDALLKTTVEPTERGGGR
jgi:DNA-binding winged helix-turn-helix (wHTH) protein/TolB-like protein/Flp pilus assembly protein TadD